MDITCLNCDAIFSNKYNLEKHKTKKIPCNVPKENTTCNTCNIHFTKPSEYKRHEKTDKHIKNITNGNHNTNLIDNTFKNEINKLLINYEKYIESNTNLSKDDKNNYNQGIINSIFMLIKK